jgi:uncharacterized protein
LEIKAAGVCNVLSGRHLEGSAKKYASRYFYMNSNIMYPDPTLQIQKAEEYIKELLTASLPPYMHYHNYDHTMDVYNAAILLAKDEHLGKDELFLLQTAALFHDCGFVNVYEKHEEEGCLIAKKILPGLGYRNDQLEAICKIILKTRINQVPETLSEKILCDADLDYLGRDDFELIGKRLYREWFEVGKVKNELEWNRKQVNFLELHRYWTHAAALKREEKKNRHLIGLKKKLTA